MSAEAPAQKKARVEEDFAAAFARLASARDGSGLHALLRSSDELLDGSSVGAGRGQGADVVAADVLRARRAGVSEEAFEALCGAMKRWCARYIGLEAEADACRWMIIPLLWLCSRPRRLAAELDAAGKTERHRRRLVEALREQFQQLHRDRRKRDGCMTVVCELLRLYFGLRQASQCTFLLAAVTQAHGGQRPDFDALPKSLAVTLCFLWGKHCVLDGNVVEAEEKLAWALSHCPPEAAANRQRILALLVPCRLRLGRLPGRSLMQRPEALAGYATVVRAVADGDVVSFARELEPKEDELIRVGSFLVVEKLRLLAYRNLCRRVYREVAAAIERAGKGQQQHKQDLRPYEIAFAWQDGFDAEETLCMLAHLIFIGAIRGYMSDEHQKIVFSKEAPFPSPTLWCQKA